MEKHEAVSRLADLLAQSRRKRCFTFSDFLTLADSMDGLRLAPAGEVYAFGGTDGCERQMLRFGDPEEMGYEEAFPIAVLRIAPRSEKFAEPLTHRDYLGALMNLGVVREAVGDIIVGEDRAYVFVKENIAAYLAESLTKVGRVFVDTRICDTVPADAAPRLEPLTVNVASLRMDALAGAVYHLARGKIKPYFAAGYVFRNGRELTNESAEPKEGDVISVRGHGKFIFREAVHETKKGRIVVRIERYV